MKRIIIIALLAIALCASGCLDKIQAAKIAVASLQIGIQSLDSILVQVAMEKKTECLKSGPEESEAFKKCYAKTAEMMVVVGKLKPQLEETLSLASSAIVAVEQKQEGKPVDYITPIKKGVCLLTTLSTWLPEKYRKKIEVFLALASHYTCDDPSGMIRTTKANQRYVLTQMNILLSDLVG